MLDLERLANEDLVNPNEYKGIERPQHHPGLDLKLIAGETEPPAPAPEIGVFAPDSNKERILQASTFDDDLLNDEDRKLLKGNEVYRELLTKGEKASFGVDVIAAKHGFRSAREPSVYWLEQGKPIPDFKDKDEAYAAVADDFINQSRSVRTQEVEKKKAIEREGIIVQQLITDAISGKDAKPTPAQFQTMRRLGVSWESVLKAREAFSYVPEYNDSWSMYAEEPIRKISMSLGDDEQAQQLFFNSFYNSRKNYAKSIYSGSYEGKEPLSLSRIGQYDPLASVAGDNPLSSFRLQAVTKTKRSLDNALEHVAGDGKPNYGYMAEDMLSTGKSGEMIEKARRDFDRGEKIKANIVNVMQKAEDDYLESDRPWFFGMGSSVNQTAGILGGVVGDTASMWIPFAGIPLMLGNTIQQRKNEGLALGLDYDEAVKRSQLFGSSDTLEELIEFSSIGKYARGIGAINKALTKTLGKTVGAGKAIKGLSWAKSKYLGSTPLQFAGSAGIGMVNEGIVEPTSGWVMKELGNLWLTDERGKYHLEDYLNDVEQLKDPRQIAALALFSKGMTAMALPAIKKETLAFTQQLEGWKSLGGTDQSFHALQKIEDPGKKLEFAGENLRHEWQTDPKAASERARAATGELASREEISALRELESFKVLQDMGFLPKFEKAEEDGKYRVELADRKSVQEPSQEKASETEPKTPGKTEEASQTTLMTSEELDEYLRVTVSENMRTAVRDVQNLLAGDVTTEALSKRGMIVSELQTPEDAKTLRALARHAVSSVRAMEATGMTREEALRQIAPEVDRNMTLGAAVRTYSDFKNRVDTARKRGELKPGEKAASNAYIVRDAAPNGGFRTILRYARGHANVVELWEETMEQAALSYCRENGTNIEEFGALLQDAQKILNEQYGNKEEFITLDRTPNYHDCIEAMSALGKSKLLANVRENQNLPEWLSKFVDFMVKFMDMFRSKVALGESLKKMEADGKLTAPLRDMIGRMTGAAEDLYADNAELNVQRFLDEHLERQKQQAALDAMLGDGVVMEQESIEESLEDRNREQQEDDEYRNQSEQEALEHLQGEHKSNGNNLTDEEIADRKDGAQRDRSSMELTMLGQDDATGVFEGGQCVKIADGAFMGFVAMDKLTLSKDVQQFKQGADSKGIVNPLVGSWRRDAPPISVWMRTDGSLEVISGRHRFSACKEADIQAVVYMENEIQNLAWAKRLDVENNIRDGQASVYEIARYVRESSMTRETAAEHGIARRGTSMKGVEVGLYASQELLDSLGNGQIEEDHAYRIAIGFKNDSEIQRTGIGILADGGTIQEAYNAMAAKAALQQIARDNAAMGMNFSTDLFGNTDTEELYKRIGKYAADKYQELGRELNAINGASRNPKVARKYGIDINDPESIRKAVNGLKELRSQWKNFAVHSELLNEANNAVMVEMGLKTKEEAQKDNGQLIPQEEEQEPMVGLFDEMPVANFSVIAKDKEGKTLSPDTFISTRDGNLDWLMIPSYKKELLNLPLRLLVGRDNNENGYGITHIVANHAHDFEKLNKTPEEYIQFVLSNISEVWSVVPGREIIVRGKKPSMAMFIQLAENDGYYSIVTAFPVREGYIKAQGKRIGSWSEITKGGKGTASPLADTLSSPFGIGVDAGGQSADNVNPKLKTVNIKDVSCITDDGRTIRGATFSIIGEKSAVFNEYHNNGLTYLDPADGKKKAILDARGVKLTRSVFSTPKGGVMKATLPAVLDFPELYRAYPELKDYIIRFFNDGKLGCAGFFSPQEKYLAVNVAHGHEETFDTVLHEVQHAIQKYEGFAFGAGEMNEKEAIDYVEKSISQLKGRNDEWTKEAVPRLESLRDDLKEGRVSPIGVYYASHGEKEARLAGTFGAGSIGASMAGMNGADMLDPASSIPLTGNITPLGGITFDKGRFGKMAMEIFSPEGDWLYDTTIFRIRAAMERVAKRVESYGEGENDGGLSLYAEVAELIRAAEKYLPESYKFGLEPYATWLNVFSSLAGTGSIDISVGKIPMKQWDKIMDKSLMKQIVNAMKGEAKDVELWAELGLSDILDHAQEYMDDYQKAYDEHYEASRDRAKARDAATLIIANQMAEDGFYEEFYKSLGAVKTHKLVGKFMQRVIKQIDRFRKDKTLGKIRRVAASVKPKRTPGEKPVRGKMMSESYGQVESYIGLMNMTTSQYDEWMDTTFPEDAKEGERYEDADPGRKFVISLYNEDGKLAPHEYTKQEIETYACYDKMNVQAAECCAKALGEYISTGRNAWDNAEIARKRELAYYTSPIEERIGTLTPVELARLKDKEAIRNIPKSPLSIMEGMTNLGQFMDCISRTPLFRGWAKGIKYRSADASINIETSELGRLEYIDRKLEEITGKKSKYEKAEWLNEFRKTHDTGITVTEREPNWNARARREYRDGLLKLLQRKTRVYGREKLLPYLAHLKLDEELKKEIVAKYGHGSNDVKDKATREAGENINRAFTPDEWGRYGSQKSYVEAKAKVLRGKSSWAKDGKKPKSYALSDISRDEAAYIILLSEQESYLDWCDARGFTPEVIEQLREYVGKEGIQFAYALREKLNDRSEVIKGLCEKRYGTPFPLEENYFRAFFDAQTELKNGDIAEGTSFGAAATGGSYGLIRARKKNHKARPDLQIGASTAFSAAMREQDILIHCSPISRDMRAFLNYTKDDFRMKDAITNVYGRATWERLSEWCDALDRTGIEYVRGSLEATKFFSAIGNAGAEVLLSWRVSSYVKQFTTIVNTLYGDDQVTAGQWLSSLGRLIKGTARMSASEMSETDEIKSRDKTKYSVLQEALSAPNNVLVSRTRRFAMIGRNNMERADVWGNSVSSAILYDAAHRRIEGQMKEAGIKPSKAELHEAAMTSVRGSLEVKGQPQNHRQRSLLAQKKTWLLLGPLYLAGESINTTIRVVSLARQGHGGKAAALYLTNGFVLTLLQMALDFMIDDEERRKKRSFVGYLSLLLSGPLSGVPLVGSVFGGAIMKGFKAMGAKDAYFAATNTMVPFTDLEKTWKDIVKIGDIADENKRWQDRVMALDRSIQTAAVLTAAATMNGTTKGKAATAGVALSTGAAINLMEFLLKTERSIEDWLAGSREE